MSTVDAVVVGAGHNGLIAAELDLAGAGLVYQEVDPFSVAVHADGRRVRFFRSVEATVDFHRRARPRRGPGLSGVRRPGHAPRAGHAACGAG